MARLRAGYIVLGAAVIAAALTAAAAALSALTLASSASAQTPQAVCSVLSGRPCHPSFCSIFHRGPCQPYYLPQLGEDLRLTIVSTDAGNQAEPLGPGGSSAGDSGTASRSRSDSDHALDSIGAMFAALRACWVPPPKNEARRGMQYTIRFAFRRDGAIVAPPRLTYASHDAPPPVRDAYRYAIDAALKRCTPLHFTAGMGGAIAGRPIAVRFVDNRSIDNTKSLQ